MKQKKLFEKITEAQEIVTKDANFSLANALTLSTNNQLVFDFNPDEMHYYCRGSLYETVQVRLSSDVGITFEGGIVGVTVDGTRTNYIVGVDGAVQFTVLKGKSYVVSYPVHDGYAAPDDETFMAGIDMRTISKSYGDTEDSVSTSIVLEEQSDPYWTIGGNTGEVDAILAEDGSWVIDEVHKKRAKLSAANDLVFEDGTAWSGTYGNAFRHIVQSYFSVKENGEGKSVLRCSRRKISEHRFPDMWMGKFKGNVHDGKLWSQPNVAATGNMTITDFFNAAQAQGSDYGIKSYFDQKYFVALHLLKFGTPSVEINERVPDNIGGGLRNTAGAYWNFNTGAAASLGDGTGEVALTDGSTNKQNKLFGVEAPTGQQDEFIQNIYAKDNMFYIYKGNQLSNTISDGHKDFLRSCEHIQGSGQYIKTMQLGEYFDILPKTVGSSSTEDWTDGFWASINGVFAVLFGGGSDNDSVCGLGFSTSDVGWTLVRAFTGSRLAFRGNIEDYEVVSGAEMEALQG